MMVYHESLIAHDCWCFVQSVEYHAVSTADVFADLFIVGVVVEHLFLYVLRWPLDLIMQRHVHLAYCVGCPEHTKTVVVLAAQHDLRALTAMSWKFRPSLQEVVGAHACRDKHRRRLEAQNRRLRLLSARWPWEEGTLIGSWEGRLLEVLEIECRCLR